MSDSAGKTRTDFFEFALERMEHEHDSLLETWKQIDTKAQATAAIAGIFLAAAFAFVRNTSLSLTFCERAALCFTVALLVAAIASATIAMLIKSAFMPLTGAKIAKMVAHVLSQSADEFDDRYNGLLADTINAWGPVNDKVRSQVNSKAGHVAWAQYAIVAASVSILVLTLVATFH